MLLCWRHGHLMTTSGSDLCRLIERARQEKPGALDQLLESYRNYLRLLARTIAARAEERAP